MSGPIRFAFPRPQSAEEQMQQEENRFRILPFLPHEAHAQLQQYTDLLNLLNQFGRDQNAKLQQLSDQLTGDATIQFIKVSTVTNIIQTIARLVRDGASFTGDIARLVGNGARVTGDIARLVGQISSAVGSQKEAQVQQNLDNLAQLIDTSKETYHVE